MPEHHDPIDELTRFGAGFGSATPGGDMPLSASDVRRRGDQIRRRRTALVAGGAALAVAAVAVPVFAVIGNGNPRADRDNIAVETPVLAQGDLLRDADTQYEIGRLGAFRTTETFEGDGQAVYLPCQQASQSSLGATNSFTRTWTYLPDQQPGDTLEPDITNDDLTQMVADFETEEAARAAYDQFAEWIVDCDGHLPGADEVHVSPQGRTVEVKDADAVIYDLNWGPVPKNLDPTGDFAYISETGLLLEGTRLSVLSVKIVGMDYNWLDEDGGSPVKRMLPTVAERLAPGALKDEPSAPTTTEPAEDTTTTDPGTTDPVISDDFPIFEGWPEDAGDGDGRVGPERTDEALGLEACGVTADDPLYTDRITARYDNAEDYRSRTLTTYASPDEAVAAVEAIRKVYAECPVGPVRDDGFTPNWAVKDTQVGGQSFAVLGWDELDGAATPYGDVTLVVRLGSSVLVVVHAGEGGAPGGGDDQRAVDQIVQESGAVVSAMCTFTAAGC